MAQIDDHLTCMELVLAVHVPHASPPGLEHAQDRNAARSGPRSSPPRGSSGPPESRGFKAMREADRRELEGFCPGFSWPLLIPPLVLLVPAGVLRSAKAQAAFPAVL
jgi:hypothetical protein